MKLFVVFGIVAFISFVSAATLPEVAYDDPIYELKPIEESVQPAAESSSNLSPIRHRRVTCDVLSFQTQWVSVNHSACAVRCLTQRRKGGRCENGVCVCRD